MKALSISTPWPTAIERHGKRLENRPRWVNAPGMLAQARRLEGQDIALHSSGTWDKAGAEYLKELTGRTYTPRDVPSRAITSVARLEAVLMYGDRFPPGQHVWYGYDIALLLANVRVLPEPISVTGALGWWEVPEDKLPQVLEQLDGLRPEPDDHTDVLNREVGA